MKKIFGSARLDENNGVVVDREIAIKLAGSNREEDFISVGLVPLGPWEYKGVRGEMFFYRTQPKVTAIETSNLRPVPR